MKQAQRLITCLLLPLLLAPALAAAKDEIRFASTAEVEVQQLNARGEKVQVRQPAELVEPGGIVIYTNSFTNIGKQPAEQIVINSPVPENTAYLGGSATEAGFDVLFSADGGKTFGKPGALTVPDRQGQPRPAEPKDYTHIRWTMKTPLKPGATGVVEFRARVK
jgi:uncharacterized repeat protein (TIGR01451 family)